MHIICIFMNMSCHVCCIFVIYLLYIMITTAGLTTCARACGNIRHVGVAVDVLHRSRDVALECRQLARHAERAVADGDVLHHVPLLLHPGAREGTADVRAVLVLASAPGE